MGQSGQRKSTSVARASGWLAGERGVRSWAALARARVLGRGGGVARLRAEGVTCGLGLPGEREREEEADRAGLGRAAGPAQKVGPRGGRWVWAGKLGLGFVLGFSFSTSISILFLTQAQLFEFKRNFEFKPL